MCVYQSRFLILIRLHHKINHVTNRSMNLILLPILKTLQGQFGWENFFAGWDSDETLLSFFIEALICLFIFILQITILNKFLFGKLNPETKFLSFSMIRRIRSSSFFYSNHKKVDLEMRKLIYDSNTLYSLTAI